MKALLARAAAISRPESGGPKLLMAVAKLATAPWVEGELHVDLSGDEDETRMEFYCEHGFGIRERLLPTHSFYIPLDEFVRAVAVAPSLIAPLSARQEPGRLLLSSSAEETDDVEIPVFEVDEASLDHDRTTAPPPFGHTMPPDASPDPLSTARPPGGFTCPPEAFADPDERVPVGSGAPPPEDRQSGEVVRGAVRGADHADVHTRPTAKIPMTPELIEAVRRATSG